MSKNTISPSATGLPDDQSDLRRMERHAQAFLDLESQIYDLKNMSTVLGTVIDDIGLGEKTATGYVKLLLSKDQLDSMHFAALHLDSMIRDLHRAYFTGYHEGETSDD